MRKLMAFALPFFLLSCTTNHYHDGKYKANVFNSTMTWVSEVQVDLDGNTLHVKHLSIVDGSIEEE
ncbi:MAG: hypothetical protein ACXVC7_17330, partial [Bacteroidia bacterium]